MKHHDGKKKINKTDGGKAKARKQLHKVKRQRIKEEIAKIFPENDGPRCSMFGGKDYFVP